MHPCYFAWNFWNMNADLGFLAWISCYMLANFGFLASDYCWVSKFEQLASKKNHIFKSNLQDSWKFLKKYRLLLLKNHIVRSHFQTSKNGRKIATALYQIKLGQAVNSCQNTPKKGKISEKQTSYSFKSSQRVLAILPDIPMRLSSSNLLLILFIKLSLSNSPYQSLFQTLPIKFYPQKKLCRAPISQYSA